MIVLKVFGGVLLAALVLFGGFLADTGWNDSRLFHAAMGRDALETACAPPVRQSLVGKGFTPTDLTFSRRPSIAFAAGSLGSGKTLAGGFTFTDGPDGPRVDGTAVCRLSGRTVTVDVEVDSLPLRTT